MATVGSLRRISAESLAEKILAEGNPRTWSFAIIDVRDEDFIGGHIKGCINVPSPQLDLMMGTLACKLRDLKMVIFHCALSQQRGPSAALKYLREKDDLIRERGEERDPRLPPINQEVFVLDQGFVGWQQLYGKDKRLTEDYIRDFWVN